VTFEEESEKEESRGIAKEAIKKSNELKEILTNEADRFSDEDLVKAYYLNRDLREIAKQNYEKQQ
jgi:hypothetical protein